MLVNGLNIVRYGVSSFKIKNGIVIYIDPYGIPEGEEKADLILLSHEHRPHFTVTDIEKLSGEKTLVIGTQRCADLYPKAKAVKPGQEFKLYGIHIQIIDAYNPSPERRHHVKGFGLGFVLNLGSTRLYYAGDTDFIPEMANVGMVDIALLPVGGGTVMGVEEAADASNTLKPKIVIPYHYTEHEGIDFKHMVVNSDVLLL